MIDEDPLIPNRLSVCGARCGECGAVGLSESHQPSGFESVSGFSQSGIRSLSLSHSISLRSWKYRIVYLGFIMLFFAVSMSI